MKIENLTLKFNQELLSKANLKLNEGLYLLVGDNGTGKTSFFNALYRNNINYEGKITINGINIIDLNVSDLRTNYISYVNQENILFNKLTVKENLNLLCKTNDDKRLKHLISSLDFKHVVVSNNKVSKLSGGEKKKLQIIIGLMSNAPVLLLDEIDNHLDIETRKRLVILLQAEKRIVLVISHNLERDFKNNITKIKLENKKLVLLDKTEYNSINHSPVGSKKQRIKTKVVKRNIPIVSLMITLLVLFLILGQIIGHVSVQLSSFVDVNYAYNSDTALIVYPPDTNRLVDALGTSEWYEKTPLVFNTNHLEYLEQSEYVEEVIPLMDPEIYTEAVEQGGEAYGISSDYEDLEGKNLAYRPLTQPKKVVDSIDTHYTKITDGEFPEDESNQILIPTDVANKYSLKVGDSVNIKSTSVEDDKTKTIEFSVVGIYENNYSEDIITSYYPNSSFEQHRDLNLHPELMSQYFEHNRFYSSEQLKEKYDSKLKYYNGFYIETGSKENLKTLSDMIYSFDPYIDMFSNVENDYNFLGRAQHTFLIKGLKEITFVLVIILLIVLLISHLLIRRIKKDEIYKLDYYGFDHVEQRGVLNKYIRKLVLAVSLTQLLFVGYLIRIIIISQTIIVSVITILMLAIFSILYFLVLNRSRL